MTIWLVAAIVVRGIESTVVILDKIIEVLGALVGALLGF